MYFLNVPQEFKAFRKRKRTTIFPTSTISH
jgi:hypothetical protein